MRSAIVTLIISMAAMYAQAQTQAAPVLHSRTEAARDNETHAGKGYSTLPDDVSGEYEIDETGSVVQITIEHNRLTGYVTKMENEAALTLFFDRTELNGNRVRFTTKAVHGLRYSFAGVIGRGDAANPGLTGYYRLSGELIVERNGMKQRERVSWKSTPREAANGQ